MNLNFRKTALLAGICSVFSLGYAPQLFAVSSTDTVEAVQQTKKITGVVSDAMGPIIGANVLEKGTTNGVITDIDGNFALNVKPGATIVVSFTLNPQLHSRSATYIKRNGLLIRKITIKSSRPFQCAYHPLTP